MKWDSYAVSENMRIWDREQKNPEALWTIQYGPLHWYAILTTAVHVAQEKQVSLPPIYFPSPKQCEQFIVHLKTKKL